MSRGTDSIGAWITGILLTTLAFLTVAVILYLPLRLFFSDYTTKLICFAVATWIVAVAIIAVAAPLFAMFFEPGWIERIRADDSYFTWAVSMPFEYFMAWMDSLGLWIVFFVMVFAFASLILSWIGALFVEPGVVVWLVTAYVGWLWMSRIVVPLFR